MNLETISSMDPQAYDLLRQTLLKHKVVRKQGIMRNSIFTHKPKFSNQKAKDLSQLPETIYESYDLTAGAPELPSNRRQADSLDLLRSKDDEGPYEHTPQPQKLSTKSPMVFKSSSRHP